MNTSISVLTEFPSPFDENFRTYVREESKNKKCLEIPTFLDLSSQRAKILHKHLKMKFKTLLWPIPYKEQAIQDSCQRGQLKSSLKFL